VRRLLRLNDQFQAFFLPDVGKPAVVVPAVPDFIQVKKVATGAGPVFDAGNQARAHAVRIKKNPVWILQYPELKFRQAVPDVFGKTGTDQKNAVPVPNRRLQWFYRKGELKIHH
jgi:hypothetical protein